MVQYTIKQQSPVHPEELMLIDRIDGDDLIVKPSGIIFGTRRDANDEIGGRLKGKFRYFRFKETVSWLIIARNFAGAVIDMTASASTIDGTIASSASANISIRFSTPPSLGRKFLLILTNALDQERTIDVGITGTPGGGKTFTIEPGATAMVSYTVKTSGLFSTFKSNFT